LHNLGTCLLLSFQVIAGERKQTERRYKNRAAFFFFPRVWLIRGIKLFHGVAVEVSHLAIFFKKNAWSLGFLASIKSD